MGQFSWCCGLCDQEVMHGPQPGYEWTKAAAILWPNGDIRRGIYEEGYGNIAGVDLVEQRGGWRLVHQRCLEKAQASVEEVYKSLKPEKHASDQGWWPGERKALEHYGPPNFQELKKDNTYFCRLCRRSWEAKWSAGVCPFGCERPKNFGDPQEVIDKGWGDHNELVEPFRYMSYGFGTADGLVICRNERSERPDWKAYHANREEFPDGPPTKIEPCFRFGDLQQARINKPEEWDEFEREDQGEFIVKCPSCKDHNVEIVVLKPTTPPNICEFCGHESEDGCHECEVHWCGGHRQEHKCEVMSE